MKKNSCFTEETGAQWEYTAKWQTDKLPFGQSNGDARLSQSRGAAWFPIKMMYPLVALVVEIIETQATPITQSGYKTLSDRVCP